MLGSELTPASGPSRTTRRQRAADLAVAHEELFVLLTTLRAAGAESLATLYFSRPPWSMSTRSAYRALGELLRVGLLAKQRVLASRSIYRLATAALTLSPRADQRASETMRKHLPPQETEYCWLRSALWAELLQRGYCVGRGRDELMALRRFLVDAQSEVVARSNDVAREAATLVLEALRAAPALTPMFRSRCLICGVSGPLNKALAACSRCRGGVEHVLSERRFQCTRCGFSSDEAGAHDGVERTGRTCESPMREVDHLAYDVAWRIMDKKREVMLVLVDNPGKRIAEQLDALPLRIVGQPRLPIILRTTDSASSFDRRHGEWVTRGDRHRELLRAFSDAPGRGVFPFKTTAEVVDIRPELQLRFSPRRKAPSHA